MVGEARPGPGTKLHIRHVKLDPARVHENVEFFRQTVLPQMQARPGFLAVRHLIDRSTGQGRVGSVWADEASLSASLAESEQRREMARDRGVDSATAAYWRCSSTPCKGGPAARKIPLRPVARGQALNPAARIGHDSVTLLRVYAPVFPGDLDTAAHALEAVRSAGRAGIARERRLRKIVSGGDPGS
jgi:hypothetical protein